MAKTKVKTEGPITLADRIDYDLKLSAGSEGKGRCCYVIIVKTEAELKEGQQLLKKSKHPNAKFLSFRVEGEERSR